MKTSLSLKALTLQIAFTAALPHPAAQGPPEDAIALTTGSLVYEITESSTSTPFSTSSVCTSPSTFTVTSAVFTTVTLDSLQEPAASSSSAVAQSVAPLATSEALGVSALSSSSTPIPSTSMSTNPTTSSITSAPLTFGTAITASSSSVPTTLTSSSSVLVSADVSVMTSLTTSQVQSVTSSMTAPIDTGSVIISLNTTNHATSQPFPTSVASATGTLSLITTGSNVIATSSVSLMPTAATSDNIFVAIASESPPPQISARADHGSPRQGITVQGSPIETNKFYANFFLGSRRSATWTHPYSLAWLGGAGKPTTSWGMSITHVEASQIDFGGSNSVTNSPSSYANPIGIQNMILSALELGGSTSMTMDSLQGFSANVNLAVSAGQTPVMTFPLVQGMGFVTAVYNDATPLVQTGIGFNTLVYAGLVHDNTARYNVALSDGNFWLIYVTPAANEPLPVLTLLNPTTIQANQSFSGTVQIAKNPGGSSANLPIFDGSAGAYPTSGSISGTAFGTSGTYTLSWTKAGNTARPLLMFALPHHVQSLVSSPYASRAKRQNAATLLTTIQLQTTTKGVATGIVGDSWTLVENDLPQSMSFAPWSPTSGSVDTISDDVAELMNQVATSELGQDMYANTVAEDSTYYSGKGLAKYAAIIYAVNDLGNNSALASTGLVKLKDVFNVFVNNTQPFPLVYDSAWGGVVSSASYTTGNAGADFGNTYYNDHHFHYGYFVYAAAVIAYLDPSWLDEGTNKEYINMLVRDYANPVSTDGYFPFSRMFDWYHGHSWAHGLFESADGKDQESSSEDTFSLYAMKMWGKVIGDPNLEARGNLQLAIQARSLSNYYLLQSDNTVEPAQILPNKVSGVIFENKIDHTTYFGTNTEYIEGIHMLPLSPASTLSRPAAFVQQEWATYFDNGRVDTVVGGWRGILYANLALVDPKTAYAFFAQTDFDVSWLDGGASRTWYLAFCAGLGGA